MDIRYRISVIQIIDTAPTGEEPKLQQKVLTDFTGGPEAAASLLSSLAESITKAKKPLAWALGFKALVEGFAKEAEKKKAAGEPSLMDDLKDLLDNSKTTR